MIRRVPVLLGLSLMILGSCSSIDDVPEIPIGELLPFEDPALAGLCEDGISDFAEGEPSPFTTRREAERNLLEEYAILKGLDIGDGTIRLRGEVVGGYTIVERPQGTFAVESTHWCYPDG